ncbi:MAG: type IV toxin-antitoxin system AbiEi family antitoxin domain-containing protein, partial [Longicatena sp.]
MSKIDKLLEFANSKRVFTAKDVVAAGFSRSTLKQAVDQNQLIRWGIGSYSSIESSPDEYREIQERSKYFIFSNETALYLHNLTDVAYPKYCVTVPTGYNVKSKTQLKAYYVRRNIYELGIEEIESPYGN